jgi:NADH dehydrogenase
VHLFALTGFKNRIAVLGNWLVAFLGRGRPQRAITGQQVFAREAIEAPAAFMTALPAPNRSGGEGLVRVRV